MTTSYKYFKWVFKHQFLLLDGPTKIISKILIINLSNSCFFLIKHYILESCFSCDKEDYIYSFHPWLRHWVCKEGRLSSWLLNPGEEQRVVCWGVFLRNARVSRTLRLLITTPSACNPALGETHTFHLGLLQQHDLSGPSLKMFTQYYIELNNKR